MISSTLPAIMQSFWGGYRRKSQRRTLREWSSKEGRNSTSRKKSSPKTSRSTISCCHTQWGSIRVSRSKTLKSSSSWLTKISKANSSLRLCRSYRRLQNLESLSLPIRSRKISSSTNPAFFKDWSSSFVIPVLPWVTSESKGKESVSKEPQNQTMLCGRTAKYRSRERSSESPFSMSSADFYWELEGMHSTNWLNYKILSLIKARDNFCPSVFLFLSRSSTSSFCSFWSSVVARKEMKLWLSLTPF